MYFMWKDTNCGWFVGYTVRYRGENHLCKTAKVTGEAPALRAATLVSFLNGGNAPANYEGVEWIGG